jgi:hypothetical protein
MTIPLLASYLRAASRGWSPYRHFVKSEIELYESRVARIRNPA